MVILEKHSVRISNQDIRFIDYCVGVFPILPSRSSVKKAIKTGQLRLNGEICESGRYLNRGDVIQLVETHNKNFTEFKMKLELIFEDDYFAVINKPSGYVVSGNQYQTIANALTYNISPSSQEDALAKPKPIHRLDGPTSGLLIVAKTAKALMELGQCLEQKQIQKTYQAIVVGKLEGEGVIDEDIEELQAITSYRTIEVTPSLRNEYVSLVELTPKTGRTHQLRIHMSNLGYPIVGDKLYGQKGNVLLKKGLYLIATKVAFKHPITAEDFSVEIELPHRFKKFLERELKRWNTYKS